MEFLNKVELRGHVGNIRVQEYGDSKVARIAVATDYTYRDRTGGVVLDAGLHNVIAWEGRNIQCLDRIQKGTQVYVEGRIRHQKYTDVQGVEHRITEIIASNVEIIKRK